MESWGHSCRQRAGPGMCPAVVLEIGLLWDEKAKKERSEGMRCQRHDRNASRPLNLRDAQTMCDGWVFSLKNKRWIDQMQPSFC